MVTLLPISLYSSLEELSRSCRVRFHRVKPLRTNMPRLSPKSSELRKKLAGVLWQFKLPEMIAAISIRLKLRVQLVQSTLYHLLRAVRWARITWPWANKMRLKNTRLTRGTLLARVTKVSRAESKWRSMRIGCHKSTDQHTRTDQCLTWQMTHSSPWETAKKTQHKWWTMTRQRSQLKKKE